MNSPKGTDVKCRQPYEKPQLRTIRLATDEVLAVGCKATGMQAVATFACGVLNNCVNNGS